MPVSKYGKRYCTEEQIAEAKACSALEYAQEHGYDLIRSGNRYIFPGHDSMIFLPDGRWYWNSRERNGRALDFLMYYEQCSFVDAVLLLAGDAQPGHKPPKPVPPPAEEVPFVLPKRSNTQKHLFAYLCGYRKLSPDIVRTLVADRRLYEAVHRYQTDECPSRWLECYNGVFLGLDAAGVPQSAFQRGLSSNSTFKSEVAGSQKIECPFCLPGRPSVEHVGFFEAAIDSIAQATLETMAGEDYTDMERVTMGGIVTVTAEHYLERHPEKRVIHLFLDADVPGKGGAAKIKLELIGRGFDEAHGYRYIEESVPGGAKDWDAYLMAIAPP